MTQSAHSSSISIIPFLLSKYLMNIEQIQVECYTNQDWSVSEGWLLTFGHLRKFLEKLDIQELSAIVINGKTIKSKRKTTQRSDSSVLSLVLTSTNLEQDYSF